MFRRTRVSAISMMVIGGLLGWLAASGRLAKTFAQDKKAGPPARASTQSAAVPGSPSATTTIDGKYIPNPPAPFAGKINLSAVDSKPGWPPTVVPPKGAPNVLLIMTDDND